MTVSKAPHLWTKESLLIKTQRYATSMLEQDRDSWQFGLWSALTLEMLTRASLASVSPVLIAEGNSWNNLYFALGHKPKESKFTPKSAGISDLLKRAESIFETFTKEMLNFSISHIERRNSEVHSGAMPFDDISKSQWLPGFYSACKTLLGEMDETLDLLFGADEARVAQTLIDGLKDDAAKAVKKTIADHKTSWKNKSQPEQKKLAAQAELLAARQKGHCVKCPACNSLALLHGHPIGAPTVNLEDQIVVEKQSLLPSTLECSACGLKVSGYSKLNACKLGDSFTLTSYSEAAEYFAAPNDDDWLRMEDDNNE